MKAYKCDICNGFCNNVATIHGIHKPYPHGKYKHLNGGTSADCCPSCYNNIMKYIAGIINKELLEDS